jgi:5-methylcytosine-specific restriction endonuclease McrA
METNAPRILRVKRVCPIKGFSLPTKTEIFVKTRRDDKQEKGFWALESKFFGEKQTILHNPV